MPVLIIGEQPSLTEEGYLKLFGSVEPHFRSAAGFIAHSGGAHPDGGWRVIELWETEADAQAFFEAHVMPNVPPGIVPQRTAYPHCRAVAGDVAISPAP